MRKLAFVQGTIISLFFQDLYLHSKMTPAPNPVQGSNINATTLSPPVNPVSSERLSALISAVDRDPQSLLDYILALEKQNSNLKALIHSSSQQVFQITTRTLGNLHVQFRMTIALLDGNLRAKGDWENHDLVREMSLNVGRIINGAEEELEAVQTKLKECVDSTSASVEDAEKKVKFEEKRKERDFERNEGGGDATERIPDTSIKDNKARTTKAMPGLGMDSNETEKAGLGGKVQSSATQTSESVPEAFRTLSNAPNSSQDRNLLSLNGMVNGKSEETRPAKTDAPYARDWIARRKPALKPQESDQIRVKNEPPKETRETPVQAEPPKQPKRAAAEVAVSLHCPMPASRMS